jgi:hypothetical protein
VLGIWRAWRDAKLPEEAPERTGVLGAVVTVTASGPGFAWSSRAAWFADAPSCEPAGSLTRVTIPLVDAAQALAVRLREIEEGLEEEQSLNLGTLTFGGAVVNLTARPDTFDDVPPPELSPAGAHVISGSLALTELREVKGWVTAADLVLLETWMKTTVNSRPSTGAWFPRSWTTPLATQRPNNGTLSIVYDVSFTVVKIR